jgi:beta-glucosidase
MLIVPEEAEGEDMERLRFPRGFAWGSATASYQIEGGAAQDGRGESIWDRFCQTPGRILHGDTGEVACDHYNRYREDVRLMKDLGHNAYRFSVSWSRVLPRGRGKVNSAGLSFYSRLVDELLAAGIEPYLTIYHWDLPQALQDIGGWTNPDMPQYFEEYCRVLLELLGGRVKKWITLNEPAVTAFKGYYGGAHAPGHNDLSSAILASYNILVAHGKAVPLVRAMCPDSDVGITLNFSPMKPHDADREQDRIAARNLDGLMNRWFLDPILKGSFPADLMDLFRSRKLTLPEVKPEDLALMGQKIDFLGVNYYFPEYVRYNEQSWPFGAETAWVEKPRTDRGWIISAGDFSDLLVRLKNEYGVGTIYITENGASYNDVINADGEVEDFARIDYLRRHLVAVHEAISAGVDIRGYFVWTLYDNFEWAFGRSSRFGIVFNDFGTQKRTIKKSGYWFKRVIEANGL